MAKTESERHFELFCERNRFEIVPVPVTIRKTPDYLLKGPQQDIVVEVKELLPTPEEQDSNRLLAERGVGNVITVAPGERVRKKIADSYPQIKARTRGTDPGLLVLWERGQCAGRHTGPSQIRAAMEGFEQVVFSGPPDSTEDSRSEMGKPHGRHRRLTERANRSISAVAVLCTPAPGTMRLQVFHNRHAAVPLKPQSLASPDVLHFALGDAPGRTTEWVQL